MATKDLATVPLVKVPKEAWEIELYDLAADPRVLRGSEVLAFNAPGDGAADLIDAGQPVTDLRVETVK